MLTGGKRERKRANVAPGYRCLPRRHAKSADGRPPPSLGNFLNPRVDPPSSMYFVDLYFHPEIIADSIMDEEKEEEKASTEPCSVLFLFSLPHLLLLLLLVPRRFFRNLYGDA